MVRRLFRGLAVVVVVALILGVGGAIWVRGQLRSSLPQIDGERRLSGLAAAVTVTRDDLGIPTIRGRTRTDVARATGFVHAQDRFFQMDLARRRAAGELAALVGRRALVADREIRIHRFRAQATRALALMSREQRDILDAYTNGVNAGLASLQTAPFEYLLLRQQPALWQPADTLLVVLSMFVTLQDDDGSYESTLATMREVLPESMFEFLAPAGSEWDAAIDGSTFDTAPIPGADVYDLRSMRRNKPSLDLPLPDDVAVGSNSFAVAGALTRDGGALLANDMHLGIRVPNTWYRAALEWPAADGTLNRLVGLTLPGVPALVAGSNTYVAWGFTNTYADWSDVVMLETDSTRPGQYKTPDGWKEFDRFTEVIAVADGGEQRLEVLWTTWGPLMPPDFRGRERAYRWTAHAVERLALNITPLETARTLDEAIGEANGIGAPGQNVLIAARDGRIAWSIYGSIPRRVGIDGRLPASWADGARGWSGWLDDGEYPRVVDPADGRLWTANARVVGGTMVGALGDGSYEIGSRASIIRDRLRGRERFDTADLLAIQLDTSATFLTRWRDLLVATLDADAAQGDARRELRELLVDAWSGNAAADSAAYRFTRAFREEVFDRVIAFVLAECYEADPEFDYTSVRRREAAIWRLVKEQPPHLLDPQFDAWNDLLLAAIDATLLQATLGRAGPLRDRVWSEFNVVAQRHPLSAAIPFAARWLDMPQVPMPGDLFTPRVHWGAIGASARMVVSPGREADGIMHMPTGQSGHPLSPFYRNSHDAWLNGTPTSFLPGSAAHTLTLVP
jgi:penicillin amidase